MAERPTEEAARAVIDAFLEERGCTLVYAMCEQGDPEDGPKCGWAFWPDDQDDDGSPLYPEWTTSYVHNDLRIEFYGFPEATHV